MKRVMLICSLLLCVLFANAQIVEDNQNVENKKFESYSVGNLNIRNYSGNYLIKASNNLIIGTSFAAASILSTVIISNATLGKSYTDTNGVTISTRDGKKSYAVSYVFAAASAGFIFVAFPINLKKAGKALNVENGR